MGYSHYWIQAGIEQDAWSALVTDARRIIAEAGIDLANWRGEGEAVLDERQISLNGRQPYDYETFSFSPIETDFDFCKTENRPYDVVVCTILLRARMTVPGFHIWSDGDWDTDWEPARSLYAKLFDPVLVSDSVFRVE